MSTTGKGETQWETRAVKKTKKRVRNRMPKSGNKIQEISLISNPNENHDRIKDDE